VHVTPEIMTALPADDDLCPAPALDGDDCNVLASAKIFRLGRAHVIERLGDGVTHFDLVVDSTEGRFSASPLVTTSTDCGMHHCTESTITRGPKLRAVTIAGRPSVLLEATVTTTDSTTDPDTGKGHSHHTSTAIFVACTRSTLSDPIWSCLRGSTDADHCTLTISGAGKMHMGCTTELTFDQPDG
jgi:hypothetical protein